MKRIALVISLAGVIAIVALIVGTAAQGSDSYRFDVIFDDARGLIPGQVVKVAGAQAGTISKVSVTPDFKARIEASVSGQFRFHTDATCVIREEGLIGENYVDCDPGSPGSPLLRAQGGHPPTVPVTHTTEPVSLLDLFGIFNAPTGQRVQVLLNELGITAAGEGDNLNAILRRANPTLTLADQVISILDRQRTELASIIDNTNTIAASGASHTAAVQGFLQRAAGLVSLTSSHAGNLQQAVDRLPGFLSAAQPALAQLDTVAKTGTPLLANLRAAAPSIDELDARLGPFVKLAEPALASISGAITAAIPALKLALPLLAQIDTYLGQSSPQGARFNQVTSNLVTHGFSENFLSAVYYVATALSRYDATSHVASVLLVGPDAGQCANYSITVTAACSAHYGSAATYTQSEAVKRTPSTAPRVTKRPAGKPAATSPSATTTTQTTTPDAGPTATAAPGSITTGTGTTAAPLTTTTPATTTTPTTPATTLETTTAPATTTPDGGTTTTTPAGATTPDPTTTTTTPAGSGTPTTSTTTTTATGTVTRTTHILQTLLTYLFK